ncbi:MAG: hypothetical protein HY537_10530, partial [Deltaproteobacteria bacterium]|nr:hypothetical protein [Deltaproteobacteria bacterium]
MSSKIKKSRWFPALLIGMMVSLFFFPILRAGAFVGWHGSTELESTLPVAANNTTGPSIALEEKDLRVVYGKYVEMEATLLGIPEGEPVEWAIAENSVPVGLELEGSSSSSVLIFGTPLFTGEWCFVLSAKLASATKLFREVCFLGDEHETLVYPKFQTDRLLPVAKVGQHYNEVVQLDSQSSSEIRGEFYDGTLPDGFEFTPDDANFAFQFWGKASAPSDSIFVLKAVNPEGAESYRQYRLQVIDEQPGPGPGPEPLCPPGYYYDTNLGYCVPIEQVICGPGTYYDAFEKKCMPYAPPPPQVICPPGSYYDHFLHACVAIETPRCPWGTHWSSCYNRCVPDFHYCPPGYRWSYATQSCERVCSHDCPAGMHYSPHHGKCVPHHSCPPGYFFDHLTQSCVHHPNKCGFGLHWDPILKRCVGNHPHCPAGTHYDHSLGKCVGQPHHPPCPHGTHYSPVTKQCVPNVQPMPHPMPQPMPVPQPMPQPMPVPHPMPQPMPVPQPMPQPMPVPQPMPQPMPVPQP